MIVAIRMQFYTHPVSKHTTLNRLNFLPSASTSARANRCAYRNGNTAVPFGRGKRKGGPDDVTKSLWRNILLIHVRLYNLAHFYSERGGPSNAPRYNAVSLQQFCPLLSKFYAGGSVLFSYQKKKKERERKEKKTMIGCVYTRICSFI